MKQIAYTICRLFSVLLLWHPAGCGTVDDIPERPFRGGERTIEVGSTTRSDVRDLFGATYDQDPNGRWEVYRAETDGIRLVLVVPFAKMRMWVYYLFITYDAEDRVNGLGTGREQSDSINRPAGRRPTLYAGRYGYHTGTRTAFSNADGGGKADSYWVDYLSNSEYAVVRHRFRGYSDALKSLCAAAELAHPCAQIELGDLFWGGRAQPYDLNEAGMPYCSSPLVKGRRLYIDKDPVYACVWYSAAGGGVLLPWCREVLSAEEVSRVERVLADRRPGRCERHLAPYICSTDPCR